MRSPLFPASIFQAAFQFTSAPSSKLHASNCIRFPSPRSHALFYFCSSLQASCIKLHPLPSPRSCASVNSTLSLIFSYFSHPKSESLVRVSLPQASVFTGALVVTGLESEGKSTWKGWHTISFILSSLLCSTFSFPTLQSQVPCLLLLLLSILLLVSFTSRW